MAGWNGSGMGGNSTPVKPKVTAKKPSPVRGLAAGAVVVVLAVAAYFAFFSGSEKPPVEKADKERGRIKEVKPAAAPKARTVTNAPAKKVGTKGLGDPFWNRPNTNGMTDVQARIWRYYQNPPPWTNTTARTMPKSRYEIFPSYTENEIACLLTLNPGETLVGTRVYSKKFTEDFLKSCETPIIIEDTDTPYQQELKKAMIQTKIELRQRMADGEDLGKILTDARNENQRLAGIRREIEGEMRELIKSSATSEEDIDDCISAANKLLESKGIAPMSLNPVTRQNFLRMIRRKQGSWK